MARKKRNKSKLLNWTGEKCYYIGKVLPSTKIVYYGGRVLEDLGDEVRCEMVCNNIHTSYSLFEITLPKKGVTLE